MAANGSGITAAGNSKNEASTAPGVGEAPPVEEETFWETRKNDVLDLLDQFRDFAWDPINRTVMGRDKKSWGEIGIFYFIFYSSLAIFWGVAIVLFLETVPEIAEGPKYTNLIERPGLQPSTGNPHLQIGGTNAGLKQNNRNLIQGSRYNTSNETEMAMLNSGPASVCSLSETAKENTACLYISLNRIVGWVPGTPSLDITCQWKDQQSVRDYGSGAFQVVHTTFPKSLFEGQGIHAYLPSNANYRNPLAILVFDLRPSKKESGSGKIKCSGKSEQLSIDTTISLSFSTPAEV